jgi:ATPase subunit of ABC transporter with duplicated ATPase domains
MEYRKHLQAFIDRWRYNANRAAQAQSKIKILEKVRAMFSIRDLSQPAMQLPELTPPAAEETESFRYVILSSWMRSEPLTSAIIKVFRRRRRFRHPCSSFPK